MAKASFTTSRGAVVTLEGEPAELADLVRRLDAPGGPAFPPNGKKSTPRNLAATTPTKLIAQLIADSYFTPPKGAGEVKLALEQGGHFYPLTSLSSVLLRAVKGKQLRRMKAEGKWVYTK